jgi:hypothetical protein
MKTPIKALTPFALFAAYLGLLLAIETWANLPYNVPAGYDAGVIGYSAPSSNFPACYHNE